MTAVLPSSAGSSRSRRWRTSISASRCSSWTYQSDRMEVRSIVAMPGSTALLYLQRHRTRSELASSYSRTPTVAHVIRFDVLGGPLQVFWRTTTAPLSLEPEADPLDIDTAPFEALMLPMPLANNNEPLAIDTSPSPCLCHRRLAHDQPPQRSCFRSGHSARWTLYCYATTGTAQHRRAVTNSLPGPSDTEDRTTRMTGGGKAATELAVAGRAKVEPPLIASLPRAAHHTTLIRWQQVAKVIPTDTSVETWTSAREDVILRLVLQLGQESLVWNTFHVENTGNKKVPASRMSRESYFRFGTIQF
jgi:hypothetical protein